jgi:hypothetical protein
MIINFNSKLSGHRKLFGRKLNSFLWPDKDELFTVYCSLFTVYCLLLTVDCLLFTVYWYLKNAFTGRPFSP